MSGRVNHPGQFSARTTYLFWSVFNERQHPQIAEQMGVSRQGAQKQLNLLAENGLVEKLPNPSHQRSPHYHLTDNGSSLFEKVNLAWQAHATKTGEVCPAGWRPGKKTLPVNTDAEKMAGRVGDYITLEEILS